MWICGPPYRHSYWKTPKIKGSNNQFRNLNPIIDLDKVLFENKTKTMKGESSHILSWTLIFAKKCHEDSNFRVLKLVAESTDKRTDVWSRPSCIYTQIFSPKKNWFFPHKIYFPKFVWLLFTFILCNFSVLTLKYFQKKFKLIFCP